MTKMLRLLIVAPGIFFFSNSLSAQNVAVNTDGSTAHASSILDAKSTNKGVLLPRMSKAQKNAIPAPATGLLVFQETPDSIGFHYFNGTIWVWLSNANTSLDTTAWLTTGNTGLNDTSFIGHRDLKPLNFRSNNSKIGRFDGATRSYFIGRGAGANGSNGYVAIGDSAGAVSANNFPGIAIGNRAGIRNTDANNTFVGSWAGENNNNGYFNTYVGTVSGRNSVNGIANTGVGMYTLSNSANAGEGNVAVGYSSLANSNGGGYNTAVGASSLLNHRRGFFSYNTAVGASSLEQDTTGFYNTGIGVSALRLNRNGTGNTAVGTNAMYNANRGNNNTAVGFESMISDTAGEVNTAMGWRSLRYNIRGANNAALGVGALEFFDSTERNTAVGRGAMIGRENIIHHHVSDNVAVGYYAQAYGDSVREVVAIGAQAAYFNNRNGVVAVGTAAGYHNSVTSTNLQQGAENTAIGHAALTGNAFGSQNTAVGYKAMSIFAPYTFFSGTAPSRNVAVGDSAMYENRSNDNVAIGYKALSNANTQGMNGNVAIGSQALAQNTSLGANNVSVGYRSMSDPVQMEESVAIGAGAMEFGDSSVWSVAIGRGAMNSFGRAEQNTAVGTWAMSSKQSGIWNTAMGLFAMELDTSGLQNTAYGTSALRSNLRSNNNTALGMNAGYYATGSSANATGNNTYVGAFSGVGVVNTSTGTFNTGVGFMSMNKNTAGYSNTAHGVYSLYNNSTGTGNVAIGDSALFNNTTASGNTALGKFAGNTIINGANNTLLGNNSDVSTSALTNATAIGYNALVAQSNSLVLGSTNVNVGVGLGAPLTKFHIYEPAAADVNLRVASSASGNEPGLEFVKVGGSDWKIRVTAGGSLVYARATDDFVAAPTDYYQMGTGSFIPSIDANNSLGSASNHWTTVYATNGTINTSDKRDKENITDLNYGLNEVMKLRPVSFNWKSNPQWGRKIGFIAQELQPVLKEVVQVGALKTKEEMKQDDGKQMVDSDKLGVYYSDIIPVTVKAIQEQQAQIELLKKQNAELLKRLEKLEKK